MVGMNESQSVQASSLLVGWARGGVFGQIGGHQLESLFFMSLKSTVWYVQNGICNKIVLSDFLYYHLNTLWMTPRLAVAVNLAQLVALASHSKFSLQNKKKQQQMTLGVNDSLNLFMHTMKYKFPFWQHNYLRNWSLVVPVCMKELAITVAVWHTEFRTASWSERKKTNSNKYKSSSWDTFVLLFVWTCKQYFGLKASHLVVILNHLCVFEDH